MEQEDRTDLENFASTWAWPNARGETEKREVGQFKRSPSFAPLTPLAPLALISCHAYKLSS